MPIDESLAFLPVNIAVLTVSDTRDLASDRSGQTLAERILASGHRLADRRIVKDEPDAIEAVLRAWIADRQVDCAITTGGTGITGRDVTPEAFSRVLEKEIPGVKPGAIRYSALGREWKVSYRSFFQVNRFLIDSLAESTLAGLSGGHALDLYAGVGLFSLPLAGRFERVTAVESGKVAMYDLEANAKAQAVSNVRIAQANVDAFLTDLGETPEVILADPPRSGLGKVAATQLGRIASPELRLVSCDPATLVRDLAVLLPAGYRIAGVTLIDLFPQTFHIETITRLVRD